MKNRNWAIKGIVFLLLLTMSVTLVNRILNPKYYYNNIWPTTSTIEKFYDMDANSVDVLFLGSSHSVTSFSPQLLYDEYGIRSYNLGTEQQNLLSSYYLLLEALRFQNIKAVVIDMRMLFPYRPEKALNTDESTTRKVIDYMKWSSIKRQAIRDICQYDLQQSKLSYYFTNIRFHTRWMDLNEDDFTFIQMGSHENLKGFTALSDKCGYEQYVPFAKDSSDEIAEPVAVSKTYLDKLVELCRKKGIKLILTKTPADTGNVARYNYLIKYASDNEVLYCDFNLDKVYHSMGYKFTEDNYDGGHLNIWGAEKVTRYMGNILRETEAITPVKDEQWEQSRDYYYQTIKSVTLKYERDLNNYLELLQDTRYSIFITIKDEGASALNENSMDLLRVLGVKTDLSGQVGKSFYAVIDNGTVIEELSENSVEHTGTIRDNLVKYYIKSAGVKGGNKCSIKIDGTEYSENARGINIVVYDNDLKRVIDNCSFDICGDEGDI